MLAGAHAQNLTPAATEGASTQTQDAAPVERVVVTGSNIPRNADEVPPTPVVTIDRAAIENSGRGTIGEVLQRLPINTGGAYNDTFTNSFAPGSSGLSLRGLGQNSTLTIIDGRRIAPYALPQNGTSSFSDLNSIPQGAVDRVEILKDGASAIYGADAIAGVVNIILRDDYQGFEVSSRYGNTTHKDTAEIREQLITGITIPKGSLLITADYYKRNEQMLSDRGYSKTADFVGNKPNATTESPGYNFVTYPSNTPGSPFNPGTPYGTDDRSSRSFPGRFTLPDGSTVSAIPGTSGASPANFQPGYIPFNYNQYITDYPQTERLGFFGKGKYEVFPWLTAYTELLYNNAKSRFSAAPTPIESNAQEGLLIAANNPYNPFGVPIGYGAGNGTSFRYRGLDFGPRTNRVETDFYRALGGVTAKLPLDFQFDTGLLYSQSRVTNTGQNYVSDPLLRASLLSTDPATAFNVFSGVPGANSQALVDSLKATTINNSRADLLLFDGKFTGPVPYAKLPAGPVMIALAGEYRDEKLNNQNDGLSASFQIAGSGGVSTTGRRDVRAGFYELDIPVFSPTWNFPGAYALDLIIAQRYEDYSDFGDYSAPKFTVRYQPIKDLTLRGSYSEGVRAPSLSELAGSNINFVTVSDPLGLGGGPDYQINSAGNPALKPEKSYALYGGFVYSPSYSFLKGLSISLDYSQIIRRQTIQPLPLSVLLTQYGQDPAGNAIVVRNADGSIDHINDFFTNVGAVKVRSIDFDVSYNYATDKFGTFSFDASGTYLQSYKVITGLGDPNPGEDGFNNKIVNYAGSDVFGVALPDFKGQASLFWRYDWGTHPVPGVGQGKDGKDGKEIIRPSGKDKNPMVAEATAGIPQSINLGVTVNYVDSYREAVENDDETQGIPQYNISPSAAESLRTVQSFTTVDLIASYTIKYATLTVGVNNVGDEKPPFLYGLDQNQTNGYDFTQANSLGRFLYGEVKLKF